MANGKFSKPRHSQDCLPTPEDLDADLISEDIPELLFSETYPQEEFDPEDALPEDFIDKAINLLHRAADFCGQYRKAVIAGICAVALLLVIGVMGAVFVSSSDPYEGKILNNVLIADTLVGGMTKEQAIAALERTIGRSYENQAMVVTMEGRTLRLEPESVKAKLNIKAAVSAAYDYGRTGTQEDREQAYQASLTGNHTIALLPYLELNEDYIHSALEAFAAKSGSILTQSSYTLEGAPKELSTDKFDPSEPGQTLVITIGTPGIFFDVDGVYDQILDAYSLFQFKVTVADVSPVTEPDPLDLDAIYRALHTDPVNPSINMSTYQPVAGAYGCDFDLETARLLVAAAEYGEVIRIPLEYPAPDEPDGSILFRDVLGQAQTPHTKNENRNTNLRLACAAINGLELLPGETFSYNDALGKRTTDKGYKPAPAYSSGELVDSIGGGICQVSSTLYLATLFSELETVFRANHSYPATYMDYGMDATVSWGGPDFQFRNSSIYPIRIEAEVSGGYVKVRILGTEVRDYDVKMEYKITNTIEPPEVYEELLPDNPEGYKDGDVIEEGVTGYYVKTYRVKYDKATGAFLSRDFVANSSYRTKDRVIAKIAEPETEATTEATEPTETAPEETQDHETEPAETKPKETEPAETKPKETEPAETKPKETQPPQTQPKETEPKTGETGSTQPSGGDSGGDAA